jgi:predicted MFS family arabinose efflux permease
MAWVISQRYRRRRRPEPHLENFLESFASAARYVRYTPGMQVILTRNFVFSLFTAAVPALVPVVALQHLQLQASQLGLVFTSMGIGSLLGATLILPYARAKASPNTLTILAGVMLVVVLVLMSIAPNLWMLLPVTALAGISWTVKGLRTLDRRTTGNARLGPRTDERCEPDGLTRRGGARRRPLGWGRDVRGPPTARLPQDR